MFNLAFLRKNFIKLCLTSYVFITLILILILLSIPNKFTSVGIYAPAEHLQGDGLSGLAGSLGGLAGLAGLNLNTSKRDSLQIALEIAKSKKFLFNLIENEDIKAKVFAVKEWDKDLRVFCHERLHLSTGIRLYFYHCPCLPFIKLYL